MVSKRRASSYDVASKRGKLETQLDGMVDTEERLRHAIAAALWSLLL